MKFNPSFSSWSERQAGFCTWLYGWEGWGIFWIQVNQINYLLYYSMRNITVYVIHATRNTNIWQQCVLVAIPCHDLTPHYVENMHHNNCPSLSYKFILSSRNCLSSLVILSYFSHRFPEGLLKGMMYVIHNNLFIKFFLQYIILHINQQWNTVFKLKKSCMMALLLLNLIELLLVKTFCLLLLDLFTLTLFAVG